MTACRRPPGRVGSGGLEPRRDPLVRRVEVGQGPAVAGDARLTGSQDVRSVTKEPAVGSPKTQRVYSHG